MTETNAIANKIWRDYTSADNLTETCLGTTTGPAGPATNP